MRAVTASAYGHSIGVAVLVLSAATAPAALAAKPITGKLSEAGLTVIALDTEGEAASARPKANGKFRVRPSARRVSLHLRAADGTYAGPVVIDRKGKKGKQAILGVDAGAELGKVRVRDGYAKLMEEVAREDQDRKRKAKARKGVPIGAGNFGRAAAQASGAPGPGQDHDLDGIPGALDVDDDGDLVLDDVDPFSGPHRAVAERRGSQAQTEIFDLTPTLALTLESTANANTPGSTDQEIEAALPAFGRLAVEVLAGDSPELDCAGDAQAQPPRPGLAYCSSGGTGKVFQPAVAPADWPDFPDCCDADVDGFGALAGDPPPGGATAFMALAHGANTSQIGTGDLLIGRVIRDGQESAFPATLRFVFATVPALASYSDTAGHAADIPYPVASEGLGTHGNGLAVARGANGDVVVTMDFWRPQRRAIADEACLESQPPCDWVDIGGLVYSAAIGHLGSPGTPPGGTAVNQPCPQTAFSSSDAQVGATSFPGQLFTDLAIDHAANPDDRLTYTLNLTTCLNSLGVAWSLDDNLDIGFDAISAQGGAVQAGASQSVAFRCDDPAGCAP